MYVRGKIQLLGMFLLILAAASTSQAAQGPVELSRAEGDCQLVRTGQELPASRGAGLKENDEIRTGAGAGADVAWGGFWGCRIMENSSVKIASMRPDDQRVVLSRGGMLFNFKTLPAGATFRLETPAAVAAVRGTKFLAKIAEDKGFGAGTTLAVKQGVVEVTTADGEELMLASGEAADVYPTRRTEVRENTLDEERELLDCKKIGPGSAAVIEKGGYES